jgi:hypothetical protein
LLEEKTAAKPVLRKKKTAAKPVLLKKKNGCEPFAEKREPVLLKTATESEASWRHLTEHAKDATSNT